MLRLLCELNLIAFATMVGALKPVYVGQFCHNWYQSRTKRAPENATSFGKKFMKILITKKIVFAKYVGSLRMVPSS